MPPKPLMRDKTCFAISKGAGGGGGDNIHKAIFPPISLGERKEKKRKEEATYMAMRVCVFRGGYHSLTSHIAPGKNPDSGCLRCQWEVPKVMYI